MTKKTLNKNKSNHVKKAPKKNASATFKHAMVNQHDEYVHNQFLKLVEILEQKKKKTKLSDYKVSRIYPLSNFFVGNVANMHKPNCSIFTFLKIAYSLGYDVKLVKKVK